MHYMYELNVQDNIQRELRKRIYTLSKTPLDKIYLKRLYVEIHGKHKAQ